MMLTSFIFLYKCYITAIPKKFKYRIPMYLYIGIATYYLANHEVEAVGITQLFISKIQYLQFSNLSLVTYTLYD